MYLHDYQFYTFFSARSMIRLPPPNYLLGDTVTRRLVAKYRYEILSYILKYIKFVEL